MPKFSTRLRHAWNAFRDVDNLTSANLGFGVTTGGRQDNFRLSRKTERSLVGGIYTRIGIDVASVPIQHVRLDENMRYSETIDSGLNNCLTLEANIDQTARSFLQDVVMSLLDEGVVAIVPIDTTINPKVSGSYDIVTMRTGKIQDWYPEHVRVNVYNQARGLKQDIILPKSTIAIVENPLYAVMNEPNSTLQRLIRKLNLLDVIDENSGSGRLDLLIQMPYVIKTESRKAQADSRRDEIERQLKDSQYGIAWVDATEKITQLNRPAENNLMAQIEFLTSMLFGQLGLTKEVSDGTADEATMLNYFNRTVDPILFALIDSMKRTFITKTGRTQGQSIIPFRDPFKLVPVSSLADIADKFTRNEIMSSNELRSVIGLKPSEEEGADELRNKNLNQPEPNPNQKNQDGQQNPDSVKQENLKMEGDKKE